MLDPDVQTRPWDDQAQADDPLYREQIGYLFAHSRFYQAKLAAAGLRTPADAGGLAGIAALPFTEKDELRQSRTEADPIGTHLSVPMRDLARIFSTSGTTGTPSYIPLTARDLGDWIRISSRSYSTSGIARGDGLISTYGAGPFVAGITLDAFTALGLRHIPVGSGNTERLMMAVRALKPQAMALTPSYALHLAEWGHDRGFDVRGSSIERLIVGGEPGGGEPAMRAKLEALWDASVTEVMGIGDIAASLWGECEAKEGMHLGGRGFVHVELIDPDSGVTVPMSDGAEGELVYTHLRQQAAPLLRFRSRDHVVVRTGPCPCGRTSPRVRCIGRTDDMLVVRGVNLFPTGLREVVNEFTPEVSGVISVRPRQKGFRQDPPVKVVVETGEGGSRPDLAERLKARIREALFVTTEIVLAPFGTLPRSDYKSKLVDWSEARSG